MAKKTVKFEEKPRRLRAIAERYYDEGDYTSALRFFRREEKRYGADSELYARIADVYENLGMYEQAIKEVYLALEFAQSEEDMIDAYEGLAVNYMNAGNEEQSAYYYNLLLNTDEQMSREEKAEIASYFARERKPSLRIAYPPEAADFTEEMDAGSKALKDGEIDKAIQAFSAVSKGNRDYVEARQLTAVALLLDGRAEEAKTACEEALQENPNDVQTLATLAAVYMELGEPEKSHALALRLCEKPLDTTDELYKVATVCCENGLHDEAYKRFTQLEKRLPSDMKVLYFKGVAAYQSGRKEEAERTLEKLCTLLPNAVVAKYYLSALKRGEEVEFTYFYRVPQAVREERCRMLIWLGKISAKEAYEYGDKEEIVECLRWCFDEMDGMDQDLQYVAFIVAVKAYAEEFLRDAFLDQRLDDFMKVEALRHVFERNRDDDYGMVLCNIYRDVAVRRISIGNKKRGHYVRGYAKVASRFAPFGERSVKRLHVAAETLYRALAFNDALDLVTESDDVAAAIYLLAGLKEFGADVDNVCAHFGANAARVRLMMTNYYTAQTE